MSTIKTIEEFLTCYKNGQQEFVALEFEHGESFENQNLNNLTFRNCWFCAIFKGANLTNTQFIDCNIKTSDFTEANLSNASIKNCAVDFATFKDAIIENFIFEDNLCQGFIVGQKDFLNLFYTE